MGSESSLQHWKQFLRMDFSFHLTSLEREVRISLIGTIIWRPRIGKHAGQYHRRVGPFNPRTVFGQLSLPTAAGRAAARNHSTEGFPLESTPYTKCELRQQTNRALTFIKTASPGEVCQLILRFSHTAEYMAVQADIANAEAQRVREAFRISGHQRKTFDAWEREILQG